MTLPAGLTNSDTRVEIFVEQSKAMAFHNGQKIQISQLSGEIYNKLFFEMLYNKDVMNILDPLHHALADKFNHFLVCRYGGMDKNADVDEHNNSHPDYYECGKHGSCPHEHIICKPLIINGEKITPREIQVIQTIANGLTDLQAADELEISINTYLTHKKNIYKKTSCQSQAQVTKLASEYGLIA